MNVRLPPSQCTCFTLRRAARHISQAYDRHLAPSGLRATQFSLLWLLSTCAPIGIQVFADMLGMDRTTLGRNLQPLERSGLVAISTAPGDRRGRHLSVTDAGRCRLIDAQRLWQEAQQAFEAQFGPSLTRDLHLSLDTIAQLPLG